MFHHWCLGEKGAHDGTPFSEGRGLSKINGVVLKRGPEDLQHITLWRFDATVYFVAFKAFGFRDHALNTVLNSFVECGLLTRLNANVGEFENHGDDIKVELMPESTVQRSEGKSCSRYAYSLMSAYLQANQSPELWPMEWSLPSGVHALCTTRVGGVSQPPFAGWNLGDHVNDDPAAVAQNRALLQAQLNGATAIFLSQVHGTDVVSLTPTTPDGTVADACVTLAPNLACTIMVADCLPLLFTDEAGGVVAAAHAGWRGLAAGVIEQIIQAMCTQGGVAPRNLRVWLGPCIGPHVFEVGDDVRDAFVLNFEGAHQKCHAYFKPHATHAGKWLADLAGLARLRLQAHGVTLISGNDSSPMWCTVTQSSKLFSYRRDGVTGRFAVCIWRS